MRCPPPHISTEYLTRERQSGLWIEKCLEHGDDEVAFDFAGSAAAHVARVEFVALGN